MNEIKKTIMRIFFGIEVIIFSVVYVFGAQGIHRAIRLHKENDALTRTIGGLETEVKKLEQDIVAWHAHPFYKEKIAREQLQMARAGEEIYYLP